MRRVPEVIDAWFDSGSMPFAQWHYPFENRELTAARYPGDFIAEGVDQTRGWFYSLLAIATGLGDALPNNAGVSMQGRMPHSSGSGPSASLADLAAPYRAVVVNDLVLDAQGQKMSKSRGNAVDPWAVLARHGADAVRLFLVGSSQVWLPRRFDETAIRETAGRFLVTLKNTYSGIFAQYANFGWSPSSRDPVPRARPPIDRWVLARLATVEETANAHLENYEATLALRAVMDFVDEDVSKWYVRLSRPRFYDVDGDDNRAAFATLHEVLCVVCRLLAPFAPFLSDWMHRELSGASVHLAPYVRAEREAVEHDLEAPMAAVRTLATLGRAAREEAGVKVRQPLSRVVCVVPPAVERAVASLVPLLAAELNVKSVEFIGSADSLVSLEAKPNFRTLGKKFGKRMPLAVQAVAALTDEALRSFERGEPLALSVENESRMLEPEDLVITRRASGDLTVSESGGFVAALDRTVTPALRREGLARELVSRVQRLRRESGFLVSDRIVLQVAGETEVEDAIREHQVWIAEEVLARELVIGGELVRQHHAARTVELDGLPVRVALNKDS